MADKKDLLNDKVIKNLVLTLFFINIVFFGLLLSYGYKTVNGEYCNVDVLETEGLGLQTLYSFDNSSDKLRFESVNHYNNQRYSVMNSYCLTANTSSSEPLLFTLLDVDEEELSEAYLTLSDDLLCFDNGFIPLEVIIACENCDSVKTGNINGYVSSSDTKYYFTDDDNLTIENNELVNQNLRSVQHCKKWFNYILWSWVRIHGVLLILVLLILGLDYMKGLLTVD